jgi:SAM-dependent methyltransferase
MPAPDALARFQTLLRDALAQGTFVKLTLGKPRPAAPDSTLRNVFARPVVLKAGPQISLLYRHATRDITKNLPPAETEAALLALLAESFLDAHLFTPLQTAQLEQSADPAKPARLRIKTADSAPPIPPTAHDRAKSRLLTPDAPWLRALGVTNERGQPREGMAHKFRQIEKFAELLQSLLAESGLAASRGSAGLPAGTSASPLRLADMGAGKGYLTFALADLLRERAEIVGLERRADLVDTCNRVAADCGFAPRLRFVEGDIPAPPAGSDIRHSSLVLRHFNTSSAATLDALIALHACDTATDDALAAGHAAGARLLVVSPCCQKELRPRLVAPEVLADALRHGIFLERQAEFVTDALRAQLLECAGYRTKVFEFVSTEHTAKNLMIAATRPPALAARGAAFTPDPAALARVRAFAAFYGIREQRLARHLGIDLA